MWALLVPKGISLCGEEEGLSQTDGAQWLARSHRRPAQAHGRWLLLGGKKGAELGQAHFPEARCLLPNLVESI